VAVRVGWVDDRSLSVVAIVLEDVVSGDTIEIQRTFQSTPAKP